MQSSGSGIGLYGTAMVDYRPAEPKCSDTTETFRNNRTLLNQKRRKCIRRKKLIEERFPGTPLQILPALVV